MYLRNAYPGIFRLANREMFGWVKHYPKSKSSVYKNYIKPELIEINQMINMNYLDKKLSDDVQLNILVGTKHLRTNIKIQ